MSHTALFSVLFCAALGTGALAHQLENVASLVAGRSTLLADRLDTLFESAPASALSEITKVAGSATESERRDLEFWLDQRLPRFYLPMTKRAVDDASHRSVLEALARDPRLAVHAADLADYVRIQVAAANRPTLERAIGASPAGRRMWPRYDLLVARLLDRHIALRPRASLLRQTVIREILPLARRSDGCDNARGWSRAACRYWLASAYDGESRAARARADLRASEESAVAAAAWSPDEDDLQSLGFFDEMTLLGGEWEYRSGLADWLEAAGRREAAAQARKRATAFEDEHAGSLARLRERIRLDGATAVPDLAVSDTAGRVVRLTEYRGKWTFIDLWGTWCGSCREEMAAVDRLFRDCQASGRPCAVLPIATPPDTAERVAAFRTSRQLAFRAFIGGDDVIAALHAPVVPHKLILTPDGKAFSLAGDWEREARHWLLAREGSVSAPAIAPAGTVQAATITPDGRWTIRAAPFDTITLITGIARCGETAWVSELHRSRITRLDLLQPTQTGERLVAEADRVLHMPAGLTVDCRQQVLHVVEREPYGVASVDAKSGRLVGRVAMPERTSADDPVLMSGTDLVVGGSSWSALNENRQDTERYYEGITIGSHVNPASKAVRPLLLPYELSCRGWGACGKPSMDSVVGDPRVAFVASLPASCRVGLYSAAPELVRTFDVRSPLFVSDGRFLGPTDARTSVLWGRTNSTISQVFAFGQVVATIHTTNDVPTDWNFTTPVRFKVLMNLHRLDGSPIALDILLPDLPIGRDEDHLYVVDYGAKGRNEPNDRVVLLSYPIPRR
jgi:thiol-disulfide isomerase/thioredoxin